MQYVNNDMYTEIKWQIALKRQVKLSTLSRFMVSAGLSDLNLVQAAKWPMKQQRNRAQ